MGRERSVDVVIAKSKDGVDGKKVMVKKLPNNRILFKGFGVSLSNIIRWVRSVIAVTRDISINIESTAILYPTSYVSKLRHDVRSSDLTIRVNTEIFHVHKSIIYAASTYLSGYLSDSGVRDIYLEGVDAKIFSLLLDLIYGLNLPADLPEMYELLNMVILFDIEGLNWEETIPKLSLSSDKVRELVKLVYPEGDTPYLVSEYIKSL